MERFNYPTIQSVMDESAELMYLMDCESYGYKKDEQERLEELEAEAERMR